MTVEASDSVKHIRRLGKWGIILNTGDLSDADRKRIRRLAKWGIVSSLVWAAGLGSAIAIINGTKIRRIRRGKIGIGKIGAGASMWCIVVGLIGVLVWGPIIYLYFSNQF